MSIVTFWNDDREQSGKTLTSVAVATTMAIERNFRILLISTSYKDVTIKNCFWPEDERSNNLKLAGLIDNKISIDSNIAVGNGIEALARLIKANKIEPNVITDYTKVVFKDRLEVLMGYMDNVEGESVYSHQSIAECYVELIKIANQYYDMVLVDLDKNIDRRIKKEILEISNLNILVMTQRLYSLNRYNKLKSKNKELIGPKCTIAIGKYNKKSKYNKKNIMRYIEERKNIDLIPFNTLFYEAAEEGKVTDLFLRLRNIKDVNDTNYFFISEINNLTNDIFKKLQELQMRMR